MNKLYSIQFLRFVAAIAVANHHFLYTLSLATGSEQHILLGAAGVDVFFVISGVVIGLCIQTNSFSEFMARRAIRIFPMLWIGTIFYIMVMRRAAVSNFGGRPMEVIHSLILWPSSDPNWYPIYPPSWTLQYELAFYILAGLTIALSRVNRIALCGVLILFIGGFNFPRPTIFGAQPGYYSTTPFLEFCAGLAISVLVQRRARLPKMAGLLSIIAAVAMLAASDVSRDGNQISVITWGVPGALLVIGFLAFDNEKWFSNRFVALGGDASFAIYMTHLGVIQLIFYYGNLFNYPMGTHPIAFIVMTIPIIALFGVVVHVTLERPILRRLRKVILPGLPSLVSRNQNARLSEPERAI